MNSPSTSRLSRLLTIDLRSLAACRIALGVVLLVDLAIRFRDIPVFMTDAGMFPRGVLPDAPLQWSLHALGGGVAWVGLLFGVHMLFACLLIAGAWTRAATIICWLLAVSLQARNPMINNSGDALLRMALFWGIFLPWGRRWSYDARRLAPLATTGPSWAAAAMLLQLCFMYWVTGGLKLNEDWLQGPALSKVAAMDFAIRPLGRQLAQYPEQLELASRIVPWAEMAAPLLLWSPWRTAALRTLVVLSMIAFHGAVELVLHVGMFGLVSQAYWLVFLPTAFWDKLAGPQRQQQIATWQAAAPPPGGRWAAAGELTCALLLLMVALFNLHCLLRIGRETEVADVESVPTSEPLADAYRWWLPQWLKLAGDGLMMHQNWMMFERPPVGDSWVVARADLPGGEQVDVLRGGVAWDPGGAPQLADALPSQHWRYYFRRLTRPKLSHLAPTAADVLLRRWNSRHDDSRQASRLTLVLFEQQYGEDGFQTRILASAGEPAEFDLDSALRELDALRP